MSELARLAGITQRTLVANGDNDILMPTVSSCLLAARSNLAHWTKDAEGGAEMGVK